MHFQDASEIDFVRFTTKEFRLLMEELPRYTKDLESVQMGELTTDFLPNLNLSGHILLCIKQITLKNDPGGTPKSLISITDYGTVFPYHRVTLSVNESKRLVEKSFLIFSAISTKEEDMCSD